MQDEPRTDRLAEGVNLPLPGVKTAHDMEEAEEHWLGSDAQVESNELHAGGRTCARCGQLIGPDEDARRTASGGYQHESCPPH